MTESLPAAGERYVQGLAVLENNGNGTAKIVGVCTSEADALGLTHWRELAAALERIASDEPFIHQTCITEVTDAALNFANRAKIQQAIARLALARVRPAAGSDR